MEIEQILTKLGLNSKEAKIYLACLELGGETVNNLAKQANIKRPTAYVVLESLISKGLVAKVPKENTTLYTAEEPRKFLESLQEKETTLLEALPLLQSLANDNRDKPKIKIYEGESGLEKVYDDIAKHNENFWYASLKDVGQKIFDKFDKILAKNRKMMMWDLLGNSESDKEYAKKNKNPNHKIKLLPPELKVTNIDSCIYGNKFAIFSVKNNIFVIVIESRYIAESFRSLYKLAWQGARDVKEVL